MTTALPQSTGIPSIWIAGSHASRDRMVFSPNQITLIGAAILFIAEHVVICMRAGFDIE